MTLIGIKQLKLSAHTPETYYTSDKKFHTYIQRNLTGTETKLVVVTLKSATFFWLR